MECRGATEYETSAKSGIAENHFLGGVTHGSAIRNQGGFIVLALRIFQP